MPLAIDLNWKLKVSAGEREVHSFRLGHVGLCKLPDSELLQFSADEHGKAVSADVLNVGHTVVAPEHAYPIWPPVNVTGVCGNLTGGMWDWTLTLAPFHST